MGSDEENNLRVSRDSSENDSGPVSRWKRAAILCGIVVLGFTLRVWNLPAETAWYDEMCSLQYLEAADLGSFIRQQRTAEPATIPFYYTLQYAWSKVFGTSALAARWMSVLFGVLSIPMLYVVSRYLHGSRAAYVAALAISLSLIHVYYSQETRAYSLVSLLALVSVYSLLRGMEDFKLSWWCVHVVANVLLGWSHLLAPLLIVGEGVYLIVAYRRHRKFLAAWIGIHFLLLISLVGWISTMDFPYLESATAVYAVPGIRDIANVYLTYAGGRFSNENPGEFLPGGRTLDPLLGVLFLALLSRFAWVALRRGRDSRDGRVNRRISPGRSLILLAILLVVPMVVVTALSHLWRPCFHYRYLLYCSLPLYLLVGAGTATLRGRGLYGGVVVAMAVLYGFQSAVLQGPFRPDYRAAATRIDSEGDDNSRVFALKEINYLAMDYNTDWPEGRLRSLGGRGELYVEPLAEHRDGRESWVVMWRWDALDEWEAHLGENGVSFSLEEFEGMPRLYLYHLEVD